MSNSEVLFMMSGSIAAYKACQTISRLVQAGHGVQVVATPAALEFVGTATLEGLTGRKVVSDLWEKGRAMDHIHLIRKADVVVAAPATAHLINRLAQGVGDDLLTTLFLAHDFKKPFLVAPAMNTSMYLHPATQDSLKKLKSWGVQILETASGVLACGESGFGKLIDPELLQQEIEVALKTEPSKIKENASQGAHSSSRPRVLITAGGTREKIDDVRVLTNVSTGRTGARLAEILWDLGHEVFYLHGEGAQQPDRPGISRASFSDFASLESQLRTRLQQGLDSHVIQMAAIADYRVSQVRDSQNRGFDDRKIPSGQKITLELEPTPKLISQLRSWNKQAHVAGFKLTSGASTDERAKAAHRVLEFSELVIGNDLSEMDSSRQGHPFTLYTHRGQTAVPGLNELAGVFSRWILGQEV